MPTTLFIWCGDVGRSFPTELVPWRPFRPACTIKQRNHPALVSKVKFNYSAPREAPYSFTMAPITPTSSAILSVLIEAKQFFLQHYLVLFVGTIVARLVYLRYLSPYRDIPGPFLATISPLWRLRGALNGSLHKDITAAHRKYGPIFRIAPDEVSISDPEAIKTIYAHGAGFIKVRAPLNCN